MPRFQRLHFEPGMGICGQQNVQNILTINEQLLTHLIWSPIITNNFNRNFSFMVSTNLIRKNLKYQVSDILPQFSPNISISFDVSNLVTFYIQ